MIQIFDSFCFWKKMGLCGNSWERIQLDHSQHFWEGLSFDGMVQGKEVNLPLTITSSKQPTFRKLKQQ